MIAITKYGFGIGLDDTNICTVRVYSTPYAMRRGIARAHPQYGNEAFQEQGQALTVAAIKDKTQPRFLMYLNLHALSAYVVSHEALHLAIAYDRLVNRCKGNYRRERNEERLADLVGGFSALIHDALVHSGAYEARK